VPVGGVENQDLRLIERSHDTFVRPCSSLAGLFRFWEPTAGRNPRRHEPRAPELSIVIPAFNEESRLPETLSRISAYVRASKRETEVIVVDDGSTDRTAMSQTPSAAKSNACA